MGTVYGVQGNFGSSNKWVIIILFAQELRRLMAYYLVIKTAPLFVGVCPTLGVRFRVANFMEYLLLCLWLKFRYLPFFISPTVPELDQAGKESKSVTQMNDQKGGWQKGKVFPPIF